MACDTPRQTIHTCGSGETGKRFGPGIRWASFDLDNYPCGFDPRLPHLKPTSKRPRLQGKSQEKIYQFSWSDIHWFVTCIIHKFLVSSLTTSIVASPAFIAKAVVAS